MTDEEYGKRYTSLVRLYRSSPGAFSPDDVDQIEYLAKTLGRRFVRDPESLDESLGTQVTDVVKQFGSGLISGFTTLPVGDDPDDVGESIARSLGQLAGFLGYIPGAGMLTKAGFTAAGRILGKTAGLGYKSQVLPGRAAAKIRQQASALSKKEGMALTGLSVPMYIGSKALSTAQKYVIPKANQALAKKLSQARTDNVIDAIESAIHLGSASAVSSWTGGIDQMIKGGLLGAVEGGVFRGITNATQLGEMFAKGGVDAAKANIAVRTISSSLYGGIQSKAFGDPIELQVYHYLLGAFFGYTDVPFTQRKAIEFINKSLGDAKDDGGVSFTEWSLNPEDIPGFKDLNKEVQSEVSDQMLMTFGKPGDVTALYAEALGEKMSKGRREELKRELARKIYEDKLDEGMPEEEAREATFKEIQGKEIEDLATRDEVFSLFEQSINQKYVPIHQANDSFVSKLRSTLEDHQIPTTIRDPLVQWTTQMSKVLSAQDPSLKEQIESKLPLDALAIAKEMQQSAKQEMSFEEFSSKLEKKTGYKLDYENTTDDPTLLPSSRLLRKAYKMVSQERPLRQMVFDPTQDGNLSLKETSGILSDQKRIAESTAPSAISKVAEANGKQIIAAKYTDNGQKSGDLYKYFFDKDDNLDVLKVRDFVLNSARMGKYVLLGKKDSGTIYLTDGLLFDDTNPEWSLDLYKKVQRIREIDPEVQIDNIYANIIQDARVSLDDFTSMEGISLKEAEDIASRMQQDALKDKMTKTRQDGTDWDSTIEYKYVYNNIKFLEDLNGISIEDMVWYNKEAREAGKSEPFIMKPADINKRAQPLADGNPSISKSVGKMRAAIVSGTDIDVAKDLNINLDEVGSDGILILSENYYNKLALDAGANPGSGFLKFTVNSNVNDGKGLLIGKLGAFKGSGSAQKLMNDNGLNALFFDTAVKQRGLREVSKLSVNKKNGFTFKEGFDAFDINPEDIRINLGVYEKAPENIRVVKQLLSTLTDKNAVNRVMDSVIRPSLEGNSELNEKYASNKLTNEEVQSLNVEDLSVGNILDIVFQPKNDRIYATPLYKKVMAHILNAPEQEGFIDPEVYKGEDNTLDNVLGAIGIDSFNGSTDRKLKVASSIGELSPLLANHYRSQSYINEVLKKYVVNRAIRPVVENSGTAFIYGNDPFSQFDNQITVKDGEYMFAKGMREHKIKWIDGTQKKLGEAWELYQKEKDSSIKSQIERALEHIVVRVPQDSPSGARVLKFAGFSNRDGYGMHLSDIDMKYLGGADNDGDKVHFFQDLDGDLGGSPVRDAIYNIKDQWSDGEGGVLDAKRNLDLRWQQSGKEMPAPKTAADGLVVNELIKTHLYTTLGNQNVGVVANKNALATAFKDVFTSGNKDMLEIDVPTNKVVKNVSRVRITKIDESLLEFFDTNREQLNVSVDATDRLPYTRKEASKIASDAIVKDFDLLDRDGNIVLKESLTLEEINSLSSVVDFTKTRIGKDLSGINETVQNKKYVDGVSRKVPIGEFFQRLETFGSKYKDQDLGNAYWEGLKLLSNSTKNTYKAVNLDAYKDEVRRSPEAMSRAIKFNTNKFFNIVNRFLGDGTNPAFSEMLSTSGISNISILRPQVDDFRTFGESRQIHDAIQNLTTLKINYDTYQAAIKSGTSEKKLQGLRRHIDAFKYMYSKMYSVDKQSPGYQRNIVLKDKMLNLKSIKNMEQLMAATESYRKKLKTKEERDYYDSYMLGSLSEHRLDIDHIAKYEFAIASGKIKDYSEAEGVLTDPNLQHVTYDYLNSEMFKTANQDKEGYGSLADKVDRVYQSTNHSDIGFTLPFVNDGMIARFIKESNDLAQAKESDVIFNDGSDPRLSQTVEELLLKNIDKSLAEKFRPEARDLIKDYKFRNITEDGPMLSFNSYWEKNNSTRPPINEKEARESATADESIRQEMTTDLITKILKAPQSKLTFDESTPYGQRNKALLDGLKMHVSKMPSNVIDHLNKVYEGHVKKELDVSNTRDMENFLMFLDSFHKKTFLEKLTGADINKQISPIYYLFFPETIGRRMTSEDANFAPEKVVQVLTTDGYKSKEVVDIMSHFEMIRRTLSSVEENKASVIPLINNKINESLSYLNDESVVNDRNDLFEVAVTIHELPNIRSLKEKLRKGNLSEEKIEEINDSIAKFNDMYESRKAKWEKLKDKEYVVYGEDGVKTVVKGADLMGSFDSNADTITRGKISQSIESLNKFFYDTFINPPEADMFVVLRNDGSLDAIATINKMRKQFESARYESEKIPNIGLSRLLELSREINYLNNTEAITKDGYKLIRDIEDPAEREQALFRIRMNERGIYSGDGINGREYQRDETGKYKLTPIIGKLNFSNYFPHLNHSDEAFNQHLEKYYLSKPQDEATYNEMIATKRWWQQGKLSDSNIAREYLNDLFKKERFKPDAKKRSDNTRFNKQGNLGGRSDRILAEWSVGINDYLQYAQSLNSDYHKTFGVIMGQEYNRDFRNKAPMGEMTESWAKFGDIYIQDFTGKPSSFPREYFEDPGLNLKRSPYYALSDDAAQGYWNKIASKFGWKTFDKASEIDTLDFQAKLQAMSRLEGKMQLMTLLSNTTSMTNNYSGGNFQTAISTGFRPWRRAHNWRWMRDNIDPSINSSAKATEMAMSFGATEAYLRGDISAVNQLKSNGKRFIEEMSALHKSDDFTFKKAKDIARRNGFSDILAGPSAWMMSKVETELRTKAFWAHYIQAREVMMADGVAFRWDDPVLIQQALKGVWASQFLYNAPNRPAIARTNLGRVFTRFQLWSWNSIKFRRDIIGQARQSGFTQGTPEYDRFVRMSQADAFVFALAAMMPISMFGNILPAPWSYLEEFSAYFFGDEEERNKAFFGQIPYPFNPIQIALPPSSRYITTGISVPIEMAIAMLSDKDLSDALDYRVTSLIPYGNLVRNLSRSVQNPVMAPQFLTGIPFTTINRIQNKMQESATLKTNGLFMAKSRYVDQEIEELLNYYKDIE